ncbi:MAG: hypothetical protein K2J67_03210 [Lachnospiraceae bacterium]|nr:hypothetical protein [Lachnospiraceae bacterium]
MAEKVYCIVKRDGNYYIPVKARYNPYNGREAYLACLPNFFGGNIERGECHYLGLAREVREESQGNVSIDAECLRASNFQLLYHCQYENRNRIDHYRFYLVTMTEDGDYFHEDVILLDNQAARPNAEKEMSCILKIPVNRLAGTNNHELLQICKDGVSSSESLGEILVDITPGSNALRDWNAHEGTKDAFSALLALR